jgi:hypothetical protein
MDEKKTDPAEKDTLEREKWNAEKIFREREVAIKEREIAAKEVELDLKRNEFAAAGWRNPLVVAIMAATLAAVGNAAISVLNGIAQRDLEDQKSEQTRILEMIKTGSPDKAAENLKFLLEAGLISDKARAGKLRDFLTAREPGSGPTLPVASGFPGATGPDDAVNIKTLPVGSSIAKAANAVGRLKVKGSDGIQSECTAFLVAEDIALTADFCVKDAVSAQLFMRDGERETPYQVVLPPVDTPTPAGAVTTSVLLKIDGHPGVKHGRLQLTSSPPILGQPLALVMFRGSAQALAVTGSSGCRVQQVQENEFVHLCSTGAGSSGAPILNADGSRVLGIHNRQGKSGAVAVRADALLKLIDRLRTKQE